MSTERPVVPQRPDGLPDARWLRAQQASARARGQRLTLWLRGSADWTAAGAHWIVTALPELARAGLGERPLAAPCQPWRSATRLLGRELELLILDAHTGFDPDGFGAATGTLRAGGLLLWLTPPVDDWERQPDPQAERIAVWPFTPAQLSRRFIARLIAVLESEPDVVCFDQGGHPACLPAQVSGAPASPQPRHPDRAIRPVEHPDHHCPAFPNDRPPLATPGELARPATPDQTRAVAAILKTAHGRARRPLVLTAHRGRGKSAALGLAAGRLVLEGGWRLLVSAPRREAVETVYRHAEAVLSEAASGTGNAVTAQQALLFRAPADLVEQRPDADLLLVDEAAGIPVPLLTALLQHYGRIVFASTVHGYEGTGRGFEIRFRDTLERLTPNWRAITLDSPIRWSADDPLERLVFRALLLDAAPAPRATLLRGAAEAPVSEWLDRDALLRDEATLHELFGLLVLAHYQTRPLDLRMLLDGPNVRVLVLRWAGHVGATLLVAEEGGLVDAKLRTAIFRGQRRPRGHLLPQTLSAHAGLMEAPGPRYWRVVRIAVHPALMRRGFGRRLLADLERDAKTAHIDLLGASLGATTDLLAFWGACGFTPVQIGTSRNAASGEQAVVVLRAISETGAHLLAAAARRLVANLPVWLAGPLRELDPAVAASIINALAMPDHAGEVPPRALAEREDEREAFVAGYRTLEASLPLLSELTRQYLAEALRTKRIDRTEAALLVAATLQLHPLTELSRRLESGGRDALLARLRRIIGQLAGGHIWPQDR